MSRQSASTGLQLPVGQESRAHQKKKIHDSLKIPGPKVCSKPMYHASLYRDPEFVPNGQEGPCRPSALKRTVLRAQFLSLFFG